MTLTTVGLALKLPEASRLTLLDDGATPLRYFPNAPVKKDYVVIPSPLARDAAALAPWIAKSMAFSRTFPTPPKAKKRR